MYEIFLICTCHEDLRKYNSEEFYKIFDRINPRLYLKKIHHHIMINIINLSLFVVVIIFHALADMDPDESCLLPSLNYFVTPAIFVVHRIYRISNKRHFCHLSNGDRRKSYRLKDELLQYKVKI